VVGKRLFLKPRLGEVLFFLGLERIDTVLKGISESFKMT
jgi:hypothetical protein